MTPLESSPGGAGPRPDHLVIVGGGLAGLAAAVALVQSADPPGITLIESRPRLGGRASSFPDPLTGELVDNCQHVSMACCTNLADFCRRVGTDHLFRRVPDVRFLSPEGKLSSLQAGPWPAPLHLSGSFLRANYLTPIERLRVAYGVARLKAWRPGSRADAGESVLSWLRRNGQTDRTIRRYWATVLISALNEQLHQMDISHARKVFVDGFLRHRDGYRMEIPLVPLGDLYGQRLESWLAERGVEVRLTTGVKAAAVDDGDSGAVRGVWLRSGEWLAADAVILAAPFDRVAGLLPEPVRARIPGLAHLERIESSPITGVHLWLDRPVCPFEHVVTVDRLIHWVFNHSAIQGRTAPGVNGTGQYLQIVISASYDLQKWTKTAIRDAVLTELAAIWPAAAAAKLLRWWVVTEHGATFAVRPGVDALRPSQRTPIPGLFLAGDWTDTGWPATMEGAVRSGYHAVEAWSADRGQPQTLIQPDLPTTWLARWTLGKSRPTARHDPAAIA